MGGMFSSTLSELPGTSWGLTESRDCRTHTSTLFWGTLIGGKPHNRPQQGCAGPQAGKSG